MITLQKLQKNPRALRVEDLMLTRSNPFVYKAVLELGRILPKQAWFCQATGIEQIPDDQTVPIMLSQHYLNMLRDCYGDYRKKNEKPNGESAYPNKKAEGIFKLEEYVSKDWLEILPDVKLQEEFMTVRFYYRGESKKYIVSKEEMRSKGIKSPNKVDSTVLALYYADEDKVFEVDDIIVPGVTPSKKKFQEYAITDMGAT